MTKKIFLKIEEDRVVVEILSLAQKGAQMSLENKVYFDLLGIHKQAIQGAPKQTLCSLLTSDILDIPSNSVLKPAVLLPVLE